LLAISSKEFSYARLPRESTRAAHLSTVTDINLLSDQSGSTLPFLQLAISYSLGFLTPIFLDKRSEILSVRDLIYSVLTLVGDISVVSAFNTTSLTSATLLTTTTILWVAPVTYFILHRGISFIRMLSIVIGFGGIFVLFVADGIGKFQSVGSVLAGVSALCYSVANVLQEDIVRHASVAVFLSRFAILARSTF
jgi:drug/metabolite transporter (DMT)-like permease